ncbi:MAG: CBS domain-containing protein [Candidatus Sumerlaeia bacterium]|nr:CBS domain-containing protein [Candidatus Sumerlaeia bacterium]
MEIKTAEQMMVPIQQYPHVSETTTLREAIQLLNQYQIKKPDGRISSPRVLLVINDDGQIVGMVRRRDILRGLEPSYLVSQPVEHPRTAFAVKPNTDLLELSYDKIADGMRARAQRPVKEVMRPIVATIRHDDPIIKAINEIVESNISILPVLKGDRVIGVVRTIDVMDEVTNLLTIL